MTPFSSPAVAAARQVLCEADADIAAGIGFVEGVHGRNIVLEALEAAKDHYFDEQMNKLTGELLAAEARITVLEAALFPFAAFADRAEQFVIDRASDGGPPVMPTKHFRLSHFRAARAALTKGE